VVLALEGKEKNDKNVLSVIEDFLETKWGFECLWPTLSQLKGPFAYIRSLREEMLYVAPFFCLHP